jgi:hypothetical protein
MHNTILTNSLNISPYRTNVVVLGFGAYDDKRNADCITLQSGGKFTCMSLIILYQILLKEISHAFKRKILFSIYEMKCVMVGNGTMVGIWIWNTCGEGSIVQESTQDS